ncbi:MAG: DUF2069 domain-containing protein [Porticoccaceae bacterium]|jgi:uncharacterized membrane protein|nr:DUF2069 domain-containing protein [Porticoccaceae bacterium]MEA3300270.1 DUF2069 domain-containing protein [Pseudomonadota bacterium]HLS98217.1 DUF2069 domain-containing protein [Porticoccaceae bacterium]
MIPALATKLTWARRLTWASYVLFLASLVIGGYLAGTPGSLIIIGTLPLILFLPGMARENHRSLSMLCFVTLFYFTVIVVRLGAPGHSAMDWVAVVLISVLFCAAMMFSRWKQYDLAYRQGRGEAPD